jgi:phosphoesterase RecJ-like protein
VLISSHLNPDGDSIGSQLAMYDLCRALGAEPTIIDHDPVDERYRFLHKFELIQQFDEKAEYPRFDAAVILEGTELSRIGNVTSLLRDDPDVINIDHHSGNGAYGKINWVDESIAAVGLMIYRLFTEANQPLSRDNADELFLAVYTDTGRFSYSNADAEALRVAAELVAAGANPKKVNDAVYSAYTEEQVRLLGELLRSMQLHHDGRSCFLLCDFDLLTKYGVDAAAMEGLVNYSLFTEGVEVGVLLREFEKNYTKISLRSQDSIDVSALARQLGGGGHTTAAGCDLNESLQVTKERLLKMISEGLTA